MPHYAYYEGFVERYLVAMRGTAHEQHYSRHIAATNTASEKQGTDGCSGRHISTAAAPCTARGF